MSAPSSNARDAKRPVLLVEEDLAARERLYDLLTQRGLAVLTVSCAEHAIKAFARIRRTIEGLSTPKGIEEYLILL